MLHIPVLKTEVLEALQPKPGEFFIDATLGAGGHAKEILARIGPSGKLLAVDADARAVEIFKSEIKNQKSEILILQRNFKDIPKILKEKNLGKADGLLLDLGLSSDELAASGRGFSFQVNEPLLMTFDNAATPVREILATHSTAQLAHIIRLYSEERYAERIAAEIKNTLRRRPIATTFDLRDAVLRAVPRSYERGRIHPATRTFLAFRIYANHEYENLETVLRALPEILRDGGRVAVITFHSGEDRVVKNVLREMSKAGALALLNKKVIVPSRDEIRTNPRSRSAKLRSAIVKVKQEVEVEHQKSGSAKFTMAIVLPTIHYEL